MRGVVELIMVVFYNKVRQFHAKKSEIVDYMQTSQLH